MAQTMVNFRMDETLKRNMEQICGEMGMSMTTAVTIFAKKMCRERRIPFDVSLDSFYSESNMNALAESARQLEAGKVVVKSLEELEAMADE